MKPGEFVGTLLHAVTVGHIFHLRAKGPGSYARHVALGALYESLSGAVDTYAETFQGAYSVIEDYPKSFDLPDATPLEWLHDLRSFVMENRASQFSEEDTHLANLVDEIQALIDSAIYKLANLE